MIALYPWILAAIAVYLVGNALNSARYFRGMADEEGWSAAERSDPLVSSAWTLTWRGIRGASATIFCYITVLAALWYCLNRSLNPPGPGDRAGFSIQTISAVMGSPAILLAYGFLALALIIVVVLPLRDRAE